MSAVTDATHASRAANIGGGVPANGGTGKVSDFAGPSTPGRNIEKLARQKSSAQNPLVANTTQAPRSQDSLSDQVVSVKNKSDGLFEQAYKVRVTGKNLSPKADFSGKNPMAQYEQVMKMGKVQNPVSAEA